MIRRVLQPLVLSRRRNYTTVIALSGGVDSSVAASLLQPTNHSIKAIHMTNWNATSHDDGSVHACSGERDWKDAQAVAAQLRLSLSRVVLEREYWNFVFEPFVHELLKGRMGNPDIGCNVHVKFGALLEHARAKFGPETRLATGHYARLWHPDASNDPPKDALATINEHSWLIDAQNTTAMSGPLLLSAVDTTKDQSYFLSGCSSTSLCNVIFPLGNLHKKETVRQLATQLQLPTATKRDSMGICFVGKRRDGFRQFVQNYLPAPTKPVEFIDIESEQVVGTTEAPEHALLWAIGQGAKIGGSAHKYFVVRRKENCIWVCQGTKHPSLFTDSLTVEAIDWVSRALPLPLQTQKELRVQCRIRHLQPLMDGTLYCKENGSFELLLDRPVRAVAPGQMAVFYIGQVCLGGGPIASAGESYFARNEELPAFVNFASHNEVGAV